MRRLSTAILALCIALVFVLYMVTYTVAYNQTAIITTFDRATDPDAAALKAGKDTGSVMQEPGLKFKWPWPIQRVQTYPTQLQVLQDTPEQLQLSDGNTIIINMALTWRIEEPLAFFKSLGTIDEAQDKLLAQMRDLRSVISTGYRFEDLVNDDPDKVKLQELETAVADKLRTQLDAIKPSYGIEIAQVTVGKMLYTESTASSVNERMTATQERKAQEIRSQGDSQAEAIVSDANSISIQLKEFANTVATQIELVGIYEANEYLTKYSEAEADEDLAIFLRQLEAIEKILANRTTFLLDAETFTPLDVLVYGHGGPGNLSRLFDKPDAEGDPTGTVPAPIATEDQAQIMRNQIDALRVRIEELQAQLETLETRPLPVRALSTAPDAEARP